MAASSLRLWRTGRWSALTTPPAVATPRVIALCTGLMYVVGGLVACATTLVEGRPGRDEGVLRLIAVTGFAIGVAVLLSRGWRSRWADHASVLGGTAMVTWGVTVSGGGTSALGYAALYVLVVVDAFFFFSWPLALAHLLGVLLLGGAALASQSFVGPDALVMGGGTVVMCSAIVGWLVRATAAAEQDPLTGLVNRRGLERRLQEAIAHAERGGPGLAVALVDLDRFKSVNDAEGHGAGDRLLRSVGRGWAGCVPPGAVLGRWGGDEFALLLSGGTGAEAARVVDELRAQLPPGRTCSAGTAEWEAGDSASLLTARADAALYQVKRTGRGRTNEHASAVADGRAVRAGLERGEFEVHLQPVVDLAAGAEVVGAEALVRWRHPERGLVMPSEFLPQAELSGVVLDVGRWVLATSCRLAASWPLRADGTHRVVNVNASGRELEQPGYAAGVRQALAEAGLPPRALVLEITEGVLDLESPTVLACLAELRELGVRVAIDDFGTGFSSLSRLGRLDLDVLKVDRSFVAAIRRADGEAPLVAAILALARALEMDVVAEGVETSEQAEWLRRNGCRDAQGYLFSRPVPAAEFALLLEAQAGRSVETAGT
ncbi:bifunctional diguanylate cyclase/phosphodiesterase [Quadrisphaera sp. DSM 44207]|uniref:putative bifunctional diguanylate cyclase/phosphodiesterase n=1 Tax=Quadrisphaera sp. DSM 44207 TaxID=1881057 RepID=UPI0015A24074|nr:EAL domain-containing protein [Quadrisphaera sp. DSM 44207]